MSIMDDTGRTKTREWQEDTSDCESLSGFADSRTSTVTLFFLNYRDSFPVAFASAFHD
jgi:hypothetical protein